ncbi:MAG: SMP-30/gluconolactonase/LRE family protein [Acidobacteria bacterium]|nr:SMP-30/gluconolactonase/LRE family protein [Acidobacteriota bacterium]
MRIKFSLVITAVIFAVLFTQSLLPQSVYLNTKAVEPIKPLIQSNNIKLLGPGNDPNPVVNRNNQIKLTVVDTNNQPITGAITYRSDSSDIATVDNNGMVSGIAPGYATITAQTPQGTISNFVLVAQVGKAKGRKVPGQVNTSTNGDVYITDPLNHVILKGNPSARIDPSVFAGRMGMRGRNDGDRQTSALFAGPLGLAIDNRAEGGIFIADSLNNNVRRIDFNNNVVTALGNGNGGTITADTVPFSQAVFRNPQGVAVASNGVLYIADTGNNAIYAADFTKQQVRLIAGSPGNAGKADGQGRAALFNRPVSISVNPGQSSFFASSTNEVIFVADAGNGVIRSISLTGEVKTIGRIPRTATLRQAANIFPNAVEDEFTFDNPQSVSVDNLGNIYVLDKSGVKVVTQNPTGRQMVSLAQANTFNQASGVVVQGNDVFVLDNGVANDDDALTMVTIGAPQIASLSQTSDRLEGGAEIIVKGKNFAPESLVVLGEKVVTDFQVISATEIRFRTPAQTAPGNRTLSIQTRGGVVQQSFNFPAKNFSDLKDGEITTIAGGVPFLGDSGKATSAAMHPIGVAIDSSGNVFVVDSTNHRIRKIDTTGVITTVAGNGTAGFSDDGSPAISASLNTPEAITLDGAGNLFIADSLNSRVRRVDAITGLITTVAGNGSYSFSGDGGLANVASLNQPSGVAVDSKGNVFIADTENHRIRKVDAQTGVITTVAGSGVSGFLGDGGQATQARLSRPKGLTIDQNGNLLITDTFNFRIRQVDLSTNLISTIAGNGQSQFNLDGIAATNASLNFPNTIAIDAIGNLYIVDTFNFRIRKVDSKTKVITTVAGTGNPGLAVDNVLATDAGLQLALGVAVDGTGNLFIADAEINYRVRRVDAVTKMITSIGGIGSRSSGGDGFLATQANLSNASGVAIDRQSNIFIADPDNYRIRRIDINSNIINTVAGFGVPGFNGDNITAINASLNDPSNVAVDSQGNLFIADTANNRIRRVDANSQIITTFAGNGMAAFSGDGMLASQASLNQPTAILFDKSGNLIIADSGNNRIRKINLSTNIITTIAGDGSPSNLNAPSGLAVAQSGNVLISDTGNNRIQRLDLTTNAITTIVGNGRAGFQGDGALAINASLNSPFGLTVDGNDNLFIADTTNNRIRRVDASTNIISTIAGNGIRAYLGDGSLATNSSLNAPKSITFDLMGNLLIADTGNTAIRAIKGVAKGQNQIATINNATYRKPRLTIDGTGFSSTVNRVTINGQDVSQFIQGQTSLTIQLKGNRKKLNLKKGANTIIVISNGISSNSFTFTL